MQCSRSLESDYVVFLNLEGSMRRSWNTCVRMISPTWCRQADHNNAWPNCCWMVTQAAVTLPVFDAVVSNVMLTIESAQCQDVSNFMISSAIMSAQRRSEPDLYAGTCSSFSSRVSPTTTVKRSADCLD